MIVNQCSQWQSNCHASNFKYVDSRVGKYRDIFENIENIDFYIYIYIYMWRICTYIAKII